LVQDTAPVADVAEMAVEHFARARAATLFGLPASADIAPAFAVSIPVSALVFEVYNPGHSRLFSSPNSDSLAKSSSFFEVHGVEHIGGSKDGHANYGT